MEVVGSVFASPGEKDKVGEVGELCVMYNQGFVTLRWTVTATMTGHHLRMDLRGHIIRPRVRILDLAALTVLGSPAVMLRA